jgi:PPM family protein phosphatase
MLINVFSRRENAKRAVHDPVRENVENKYPYNSVLSASSVTNKVTEDANQDAVVVVRNSYRHFNAFAVADGIGGLRFGGEAARLAISAAEELLLSHEPFRFRDIFVGIQLYLKRGASRIVKGDELDQFGTTLILAVETSTRFLVGYLGNGSLWHVRGNYHNCQNERRSIPWCAVNLLNPHSIEKEGREVLTRFLSPLALYEPTIIEIYKDSIEGDVLIATTDGLSSADQVQVGCDGNGTQWTRAEMWLPQILSRLKPALSGGDVSTTLHNYLHEKKQRGELDDDTTIATLISQEAIASIMRDGKQNE